MGHDNVLKRDRPHRRLVGQIIETHGSQHRIKIGVAYAFPSQYEKSRAVHKLRRKESA